MKHLSDQAARVVAAPVSPDSPSGGNSIGIPGPNQGGPGLTPCSSAAATDARQMSCGSVRQLVRLGTEVAGATGKSA